MTFVDFEYVMTADNFTANTGDGTNLTLWGADGTYLDSNVEGGGVGKFDTSTTTIGFDFVGVTGEIFNPEPSSFILLLMGTTCLGGVGYWRRRRRCLPKQA
ncbi:MAG: PEP-CTERM sorting domain-containing protein [Planctomycetes bacterium]|nr:PEP-CTERM sorting domain-containing protein [Planctomycetota bacterium]